MLDTGSLRNAYRRAYDHAREQWGDDALTAEAYAHYCLHHETEYDRAGRVQFATNHVTAYERFWLSADGAALRARQGGRADRWEAA